MSPPAGDQPGATPTAGGPAGRLEAIWVKRAKLGPMDPRPAVELVAGRGLAGNADQGGRRQVTLIEAERWAAACAAVGTEVAPTARRANLLIAGLASAEPALPGARGRVLRVGPARIVIRGETRPCERMEAACPGLKAALAAGGRGGAYGEVITGGTIAAGDAVRWEDPAP